MSKCVYNLYEAKTSLSSLVDRAAAGEHIIIAKAGVAKVKLVAIRAATKKRKPGGWEGRVRIKDDFDDPLPDDVQESFEGRRA